jgi:ABC-type transport system substrate-binding protein
VRFHRRTITLAALATALTIAGCGRREAPSVTVTWVVGQATPSFDPQGPPDPVRWSIERLLSTGLVAEDSIGRIVPAAAESIRLAPGGLEYTFLLRRDLTFADGRPCVAEDFRRSLESGIGRLDHGTYAWLLSPVTGMDKVRVGRPLPPLGIAAPDPRTVVIRLARSDSTFLRKLALPGVSEPWKGEGTGWGLGIGDYKVLEQGPGRLMLARRSRRPGTADTILMKFYPTASRVRAALRANAADLVWPLPADLLDEALPAGYRSESRRARPTRMLLLLQEADLPPTSRDAARHAFAHGVNLGEILAELAPVGTNSGEWLPRGRPYDFPTHDPEEVRAWLERGKLGRSLHVVMTYSLDGPAAQIARAMQGGWAANGLDVELRPLRQPQATTEWLRRGGAQLRLVESQALLDSPQAALAAWVLPLRGPAVGNARTGWITREFDRWLVAGEPMSADDVAAAQQRIAEERIVLPLAELPWVWIARPAASPGFHPRFGPEIAELIPQATPQDR